MSMAIANNEALTLRCRSEHDQMIILRFSKLDEFGIFGFRLLECKLKPPLYFVVSISWHSYGICVRCNESQNWE